MKAVFEITPHFRTILDIPNRIPNYRMVLLSEISAIVKYDEAKLEAMEPTKITTLLFNYRGDFKTEVNNQEVILPRYIFSRIE